MIRYAGIWSCPNEGVAKVALRSLAEFAIVRPLPISDREVEFTRRDLDSLNRFSGFIAYTHSEHQFNCVLGTRFETPLPPSSLTTPWKAELPRLRHGSGR